MQIPLKGINRILVSKGIDVIHKRLNPGLNSLIEVSKIKSKVSVYDLGFKIGPLINAGGRLGYSSFGTELLTESNKQKIDTLSKNLDKFNTERRTIESYVLDQAMAQVDEEKLKNNLLIVAGEDWHEGIIGIIASRIKDKFNKPTIIISINNELVRSASEFISMLRMYEIGDIVNIGLIRNEQELTIETKLIEHVEYENEPMVGFLASTPNQQFIFPFEVDIKTGNVGGPSAGMMMALNVYNLLTEDDITNGKKIAGTGTIEIDGSIGPVGGVKQKVIAAKRANAGLILVPTANYEEASVFADDNTQIVAVDSFDNALNVIFDFSSR